MGAFLAGSVGRPRFGPSGYLCYRKRQVFVACDGDEFALPGVVSLIGSDNLLWNTDYPHPDAPDPNKALPDFLNQPIPEESKRKILWDNPARLYGERVAADS